MSQTITVIYADGVLRPLAPLDLPEQTEIELEVLKVGDREEDERSRVLRALADAGVIINRPHGFGRLKMNQTITTIYANGVLRPTTPLDLPEQSQVEIEVKQVVAPEAEQLDERRRFHQALVAAGLALEHPVNPVPAAPLSPEERERLGLIFAVGKPLSEIIMEEREGR